MPCFSAYIRLYRLQLDGNFKLFFAFVYPVFTVKHHALQIVPACAPLGNNAAKMLTKIETAYNELMSELSEDARADDGESSFARVEELIRTGDIPEAARPPQRRNKCRKELFQTCAEFCFYPLPATAVTKAIKAHIQVTALQTGRTPVAAHLLVGVGRHCLTLINGTARIVFRVVIYFIVKLFIGFFVFVVVRLQLDGNFKLFFAFVYPVFNG